MKRLLCAFLALCAGPFQASALTGATEDSTDRFPFVVEVRLDNSLICSGTVLYPRIVVTAAHCLQQKLSWKGVQFYVDDYLPAGALSVTVVREGKTERYKVADTAISPSWRVLVQEGSIQRFLHDLALIITDRPIAVDLPAHTLPAWLSKDNPAELAARSVLGKGLFVAFGGADCSSRSDCGDAGVRRSVAVVIRDKSYCFRSERERSQVEAVALWCLEHGAMPGDSGGPLLIEDDNGSLHFVGVISAQQGLPPEFSGVNSRRRSLAADLGANRPFIDEKARALGYAPPEP